MKQYNYYKKEKKEEYIEKQKYMIKVRDHIHYLEYLLKVVQNILV